jgi:hypothetical protein
MDVNGTGNALAYKDTATMSAVKSIMVLAPGANPINVFTAVIYGFLE